MRKVNEYQVTLNRIEGWPVPVSYMIFTYPHDPMRTHPIFKGLRLKDRFFEDAHVWKIDGIKVEDGTMLDSLCQQTQTHSTPFESGGLSLFRISVIGELIGSVLYVDIEEDE